MVYWRDVVSNISPINSSFQRDLRLEKINNYRNYRGLKVWQKAMDMVIACYQITKVFPKNEIYGLTSQIQRAAVSVPANIAEGNGREHQREYLHHLSIAHGSLMELETHVLIAGRLEYVETSEVDAILAMTDEVGRMLSGLRKHLKSKL